MKLFNNCSVLSLKSQSSVATIAFTKQNFTCSLVIFPRNDYDLFEGRVARHQISYRSIWVFCFSDNFLGNSTVPGVPTKTLFVCLVFQISPPTQVTLSCYFYIINSIKKAAWQQQWLAGDRCTTPFFCNSCRDFVEAWACDARQTSLFAFWWKPPHGNSVKENKTQFDAKDEMTRKANESIKQDKHLKAFPSVLQQDAALLPKAWSNHPTLRVSYLRFLKPPSHSAHPRSHGYKTETFIITHKGYHRTLFS